MADGVISFPFRVDRQGHIAVAGHGTDREIDEAIAVLTLTLLGERPMTPAFGIPDPAFSGLHPGDVQVALDEHGPAGVTITSIAQEPLNDLQAVAAIRWQRSDDTMETNQR
ncbi:hypothetical protein ACQCSX_04515 [Pseudarthrobacter sp. P1]|uniref:hypothetical protein n=1 Tax=Pseudarthrobacter sp. P1 TaxID=3418418 RepID=UPI003CF73232